MESHSSGKGDPSKSPMSHSGKGDPSGKTPAPDRLPISRPPPEHGTKGRRIMLLTNHFKVSVKRTHDFFYHYSRGLQETYASVLAHKEFAYDGDKSLFTVGPLPFQTNVFEVVLLNASSGKVATSRSPGGDGSPGASDKKRMKRPAQNKRFKVEIKFAAKVPMSAIADAMRGQESEDSLEALRVLDIILRHHSARQGCLLVRQSFFRGDFGSVQLGGGIVGCRGFHSSFRPTQSGLSLNIDVSTTMLVKPGPVIDFLLFNQNINHTSGIDWYKAKRALNKLRIKTTHRNVEFTIVGLTENICSKQTFPLNRRDGSGTVEVTVYDYFMNHWSMKLTDSAHLPCLIVGKSKRPTYLPLEVCHLVPLQRYKKSLSTQQRSRLVEGSRQKPHDRMLSLSNRLRGNNYDSEPMLRECGISIAREFTQVEARVLQAPKLNARDDRELYPSNGRWNFNKDRLYRAIKVNSWAAVVFSARCNVQDLVSRLIECGNMKGIEMGQPHAVIKERPQMIRNSPVERVDDMFKQIRDRKEFKQGPPKFILCVLPEKNCDIYGPWKRKCLADHGIVTQCLVPPANIKDQYLTNVLLKINAKLGGLNSLLHSEITHAIPHVSNVPTIIFGMDVSHGSPGSNVPSVAAVVSSFEWPLISKYRAAVCTQSPRQEMIETLFKPVGDDDSGLINDSLNDFRSKTRVQRPEQIIIFRDGVSESQFNDVLDKERAPIVQACELYGNKYFEGQWFPKFTVIVAQKNHHTRFFLPNERKRDDVINVSPGTVVDKGICNPRKYDFYMCAHAGMIGTTRPTHYHVLYDDIGFSPDELQELVHSLSYVYQRSTTAISVVAPIYYAHLAAAQVSKFIRPDDMSETSSSRGAQATSAPVQELPRLNNKVASSMFFC